MEKIKGIAFIIIGVVMAYLGLLAIQPVLTSTSAASAVEVADRASIDQYVGAVEAVQIVPWVIWFVPAAIGVAALVVVLRRDTGG